MICTKCGNKTKVTESRPSLSGYEVIRIRKCTKCRKVFKTYEWEDDSEDIEDEWREISRRLKRRYLDGK